MAKWLVLGLGNPLSGADAFGPAVIERLRGDPEWTGADLIDAHTDLLAYIDRFGGYDDVVLVDTVIAADGPCVTAVAEETFSKWDAPSLGAHELSAIACVKLFRTLQRAPGARHPAIALIAHFVKEEDFGLPPAAEDVLAGAAAVRALLVHCPSVSFRG
jgi:hydrogenase maturation protease